MGLAMWYATIRFPLTTLRTTPPVITPSFPPLLRTRAEAEAALQRERARAGSAKTVSELQALVAGLQGQLAAAQARAKLDKVCVSKGVY